MGKKLSIEIPIIGSEDSWLSIDAGPDGNELNISIAFPSPPSYVCSVEIFRQTSRIGFDFLGLKKKTEPEGYDTFHFHMNIPNGLSDGEYTVNIICGPVEFKTNFTYPFVQNHNKRSFK